MKRPISDKERKRIIKALGKGLKIAPGKEEVLARIDLSKKPTDADWALTKVYVDSCWGPWSRKECPVTLDPAAGNAGGFDVAWETRGCGFGSLTFYIKDGKLMCDNEGMGRDFIKKVLSKMVDETLLDDEPKAKNE